MVLFFAARKLWLAGMVIPQLNQGVTVLTDRCHTSTGAYQGHAEGGDMDQILAISDIVLGDYKPDAVILLNISSQTSEQRRGNNTEGDPFDEQGKNYLEKLVKGYQSMAEESWGGLAWYVIDGEGSVEEVFLRVKTVLEKILDQTLS